MAFYWHKMSVTNGYRHTCAHAIERHFLLKHFRLRIGLSTQRWKRHHGGENTQLQRHPMFLSVCWENIESPRTASRTYKHCITWVGWVKLVALCVKHTRAHMPFASISEGERTKHRLSQKKALWQRLKTAHMFLVLPLCVLLVCRSYGSFDGLVWQLLLKSKHPP